MELLNKNQIASMQANAKHIEIEVSKFLTKANIAKNNLNINNLKTVSKQITSTVNEAIKNSDSKKMLAIISKIYGASVEFVSLILICKKLNLITEPDYCLLRKAADNFNISLKEFKNATELITN